jgi:hypothetical protein
MGCATAARQGSCSARPDLLCPPDQVLAREDVGAVCEFVVCSYRIRWEDIAVVAHHRLRLYQPRWCCRSDAAQNIELQTKRAGKQQMITMPPPIQTAYHLVDASNWVSVQNYGLMSARRLMEVCGGMEDRALRYHRPASLRLPSGVLIRDQRPMPRKALMRCLKNGLTPEDWFELLNSKVFFWLDASRLNRQRLACGASPQVALVVNAARLLMNYSGSAAVTPINTGNALRCAAPRNLTTFVPYQRWLIDGWAFEHIQGARARARSHRPVELTISQAVPDILDYVMAAVPLNAGEILDPERLAPIAADRPNGKQRIPKRLNQSLHPVRDCSPR